MKAAQALLQRDPSSFRDPDGFVFQSGGEVLRWVSHGYREHFTRFVQSGLRDRLITDGLLQPFEELPVRPAEAHCILKAERVPFISYPYEWCFSALKDAALATLRIQRLALDHGMSLKDASAFNIQFVGGQPRLIDILSFEVYRPGQPWVALSQFCRHFLAPLSLMAFRDARLNQLWRSHLDGVPLDLCSRLLPRRTWARPGLLLYIHLQALTGRMSDQRAGKATAPGERNFSLNAFRGLLDQLERTITHLRWKSSDRSWASYASHELLTSTYFVSKTRVVEKYLDDVRPGTAWDLGANQGQFSRLAASKGTMVIALDAEHACVEAGYRAQRTDGVRNLLPLCVDLTNPSARVGWANEERQDLFSRGRPDLVIALALVHHLAIGHNVPLRDIADLFARCARHLIVEFVPKPDRRVQEMLRGREDVFDAYTQEHFESEFQRHFFIRSTDPLPDSSRVLYLMERRGNA